MFRNLILVALLAFAGPAAAQTVISTDQTLTQTVAADATLTVNSGAIVTGGGRADAMVQFGERAVAVNAGRIVAADNGIFQGNAGARGENRGGGSIVSVQHAVSQLGAGSTFVNAGSIRTSGGGDGISQIRRGGWVRNAAGASIVAGGHGVAQGAQNQGGGMLINRGTIRVSAASRHAAVQYGGGVWVENDGMLVAGGVTPAEHDDATPDSNSPTATHDPPATS